jgi:hypothetical protein
MNDLTWKVLDKTFPFSIGFLFLFMIGTLIYVDRKEARQIRDCAATRGVALHGLAGAVCISPNEYMQWHELK